MPTPTHATKPFPVSAVMALCIGLATVGTFSGVGLNYSDFYREAIAEIGLLGMLGYHLYRNRRAAHATVTLSATRMWLLGLLLLSTVSVFWAVNFAFFISKYLLWLATAAVVLLMLTRSPSGKVMLNVARGLAFIAAYIAIIGLLQAWSSVDIFMQHTPPAANLVNKNAAMQVIVLSFPMLFFLLLFDPHKYLAKLYPFLIVLVLAYAFYAQTRSAWLAIALEFMVMAVGFIYCRAWFKKPPRSGKAIGAANWRSSWRDRYKLTAIAASLALLVLLVVAGYGWSQFVETISAGMHSIYQDVASFTSPLLGVKAQRYQIWEAALRMLASNPWVGSGMGSFYYNLLIDAENYTVFAVLRVHNDLLESGVELGVIGLLALFGAIIGLLLGLVKLITRGALQQRMFYLLVAAALLGNAMSVQFSFPYQMPIPLTILGLYIGLIIKGGDAYNVNLKTISVPLKKLHRYAGLTALGCMLALIVSVHAAWLQTMATVDYNVKHTNYAWEDPIRGNPLRCHKSTVFALFSLADGYFDVGSYQNSLRIVESINQCISDTWLAQQKSVQSLSALQQYEPALSVLEQAKKHAPIGFYLDHVNQILTYNALNDLPGVIRIYEQLRDQPVPLLIRKQKNLRALVATAAFLNRRQDVRKFYRLHDEYYAYDENFHQKFTQWLE